MSQTAGARWWGVDDPTWPVPKIGVGAVLSMILVGLLSLMLAGTTVAVASSPLGASGHWLWVAGSVVVAGGCLALLAWYARWRMDKRTRRALAFPWRDRRRMSWALLRARDPAPTDLWLAAGVVHLQQANRFVPLLYLAPLSVQVPEAMAYPAGRGSALLGLLVLYAVLVAVLEAVPFRVRRTYRRALAAHLPAGTY